MVFSVTIQIAALVCSGYTDLWQWSMREDQCINMSTMLMHSPRISGSGDCDSFKSIILKVLMALS